MLTVTFSAQVVKNATTQADGRVEITMMVVDLGNKVDVLATKKGYKDLEFSLDLGTDGQPTGEIPVMEKEEKEDEPGFGSVLCVVAVGFAWALMRRRRD